MTVENNTNFSSLINKPQMNAIQASYKESAKPLSNDSVELSSNQKENKAEKKNSKLKGVMGLIGLLGLTALTTYTIYARRRFNPERMKKEYAQTLNRALTKDEIANIEKKCKSHRPTGVDFIDEVITAICLF